MFGEDVYDIKPRSDLFDWVHSAAVLFTALICVWAPGSSQQCDALLVLDQVDKSLDPKGVEHPDENRFGVSWQGKRSAGGLQKWDPSSLSTKSMLA